VKSVTPPQDEEEELEHIESAVEEDGNSSKDEEIVEGVDDLESISNHSEQAPRIDLNSPESKSENKSSVNKCCNSSEGSSQEDKTTKEGSTNSAE